jgi:hypothetical protein
VADTYMPANLTPEYKAAEAVFRKARDPGERLEWLRGMLRVIPKHKGTDHLQGDIKRRIKELSEELERPRRGGAHGGPALVIRPEGAAQIALLGPPNAGKSSLHARLTGSGAQVAPYPCAPVRAGVGNNGIWWPARGTRPPGGRRGRDRAPYLTSAGRRRSLFIHVHGAHWILRHDALLASRFAHRTTFLWWKGMIDGHEIESFDVFVDNAEGLLGRSEPSPIARSRPSRSSGGRSTKS